MLYLPTTMAALIDSYNFLLAKIYTSLKFASMKGSHFEPTLKEKNADPIFQFRRVDYEIYANLLKIYVHLELWQIC